ncbi:hypothetical protein AXK61_22000 [Tsukamurella pseudospumae]|uniref:Uncharacterized protein n=1 Tax=Tsukamurella pseudospumae TaxID=239498 RepID=A0A137ZHN9_9ACTN|nr:hypothetical protein AXK61_22000 [Tsukamurella pseudospumae]
MVALCGRAPISFRRYGDGIRVVDVDGRVRVVRVVRAGPGELLEHHVHQRPRLWGQHPGEPGHQILALPPDRQFAVAGDVLGGRFGPVGIEELAGPVAELGDVVGGAAADGGGDQHVLQIVQRGVGEFAGALVEGLLDGDGVPLGEQAVALRPREHGQPGFGCVSALLPRRARPGAADAVLGFTAGEVELIDQHLLRARVPELPGQALLDAHLGEPVLGAGHLPCGAFEPTQPIEHLLRGEHDGVGCRETLRGLFEGGERGEILSGGRILDHWYPLSLQQVYAEIRVNAIYTNTYPMSGACSSLGTPREGSAGCA